MISTSLLYVICRSETVLDLPSISNARKDTRGMVSETLIVRVEHGPMVTTGQSAQVSHSKLGQNRSLVGHDMRH